MLWSCLILLAEQAFVPAQWGRASVQKEAVFEWFCLGLVGAIVGTGALVFSMGTIEIDGLTHCSNWHRKHDPVRLVDGPLPPLSPEHPGNLLLKHAVHLSGSIPSKS